jgi:hypothetical protein
MTLRFGQALFLFASLGIVTAPAQQVSGTISGAVRDAQQAAVANAKIILTNAAQGITRETATTTDGNFAFALLPPASYNLSVSVPGFKRYEQKDIKIFASDRIAIPDIVLELGTVSDTVTVESSSVQLQTQSAERAGVVTGRQVTELAVKARNFFDLAITAPGVYYRPGGTGMGNIVSNGNRPDQNNLQADGITNVDTGNNADILATMNIDQIAEFKILTNSQPAEIGRSSGAQIQVITKSGTKEFHGSGYWFHRHEGLNANNWRNNIEGRARNLFRYNYEGYTIGGPILLPGNFNRDRNKLFFFWSQEFQNSLVPNSVQSVTVPTDLQRRGDFSQTRDGSGNPVVINDPANNKTPFPGNIIPANRLNADGVKILGFYPQPNRVGVDNGYNYQSQVSDSQPRREQMLRGDYNINDKWRVFSRYLFTKSEINKAYGQWNANYNIPYAPMNFGNPGWSIITNVTTVISPTLTNEFIFGSSKNKLNIDPVDDSFDRKKLGLSYTMPFPNADKLGLVQNWRFQNVPNGPFTAFNGTPFRNFNHTWEFTDNISKVMNAHTVKAGIYLHRSWKDQTAFTATNGDIFFNRDGSNPLDSNWDFANAALGNYQRVEQSNVVLNGQYRSWNVEWFVQDNWKVSKKLTLDFGMRFYWIQPQFDQAKQTSSFNPSLYDPAAAGVLNQRAINPATGALASYNPVTGTYGGSNLIGTLVQTGRGFTNGLYANGMGLAGQNGYPVGLIDDRGIHFAPRFGLAYQFDGKTVLRAGGGTYYDRFQGNDVFDQLTNPPATVRPTFYYGNLASLGASQGVFAPANVRGFDKKGQVPTTYNWNISIQRELPQRVVLDIGYVGMKSLHNLARYNLNTVPFGSAWLPQNQDPTIASPVLNGTNTNAINFYRPYLGYGDINISQFGAFSNYNALQVSVSRRIGQNFTFGANYTWGRSLGIAGARDSNLHPTNYRMANYGPMPFDVPHMFVLNYTWYLPKGAKGFMNNAFGRAALNGWEISGITSFFMGEPDFINIGDLPRPNGTQVSGDERNRIYTGSQSVAARPFYTGNPNDTSKDILAWINPAVIKAPIIGQSFGLESGQAPIRKPGVNNWDVSIFKNFRLWSESSNLQLRCEMFNAFNHTQFSDFNRTVNFNSLGAIANLPSPTNRFGFGAITAARDPRIIQLAARIRF